MAQSKAQPEAIKIAMSVLSEMAEGAEHQEWQKLLPGFAMTLHRAGQEVTDTILKEYIAQGQQAVYDLAKDLRQSYKHDQSKENRSYRQIVKKLRQRDDERAEQDVSQEDLDAITEGYSLAKENIVIKLIEKDDIESLQYLSDNGYRFRGAEVNDFRFVEAAVENNSPDALKLLRRHGVNTRVFSDKMIVCAAEKGHLDVVKIMYEQGFDVRVYDNGAMRAAMNHGYEDIVAFLHSCGADVTGDCEKEMSMVLHMGYHNVARYCHDNGIYESTETGQETQDKKRDALKETFARMDAWKEVHGEYPADGLDGVSPYLFRKNAFELVQTCLRAEGYKKGKICHRYAFHASALFGTPERVLDYLEKWGDGKTHQPLHNVIHDIELPKNGGMDLTAWGDALMRHGPKMAGLVKFGDKLRQPLKDSNGNWAYLKTKKEASKYVYSNGHEYPELANQCMNYTWHEEQFQEAVAQIQKYIKKYGGVDQPKTKQALPDIQIDGLAFEKHGYRFYKMPDGDLRGLFLGEMTNCCQHLAGAGEDCAKHGFTSEHSGFYVVENKDTGQIVGQSWAWRGKKGELVLDSLESLSGHFNEQKWTKLCKKIADYLNENKTDITALHVGTGGETPILSFADADDPAIPKKYKGYRDSEQQYQIWTQNKKKQMKR